MAAPIRTVKRHSGMVCRKPGNLNVNSKMTGIEININVPGQGTLYFAIVSTSFQLVGLICIHLKAILKLLICFIASSNSLRSIYRAINTAFLRIALEKHFNDRN